jgi:hypothetical protein
LRDSSCHLRPDLIVALADRNLAVGNLLLEVGVAADPLLAGFDQRRNAERGVTQRAHRAGLHAAIVHRPFADADLGEADLDEIARRWRQEFANALGVVQFGELLFPILDVEPDDQIGVLQRRLIHAETERVLVRES